MILNIAAYRFVDLDGLDERRARLLQAGRSLGLRGTVLLAPEGVNLFVSGEPDPVRSLLRLLEDDAPLAGMELKESWSESVSFRRWRVRIKREIVTLRRPRIRPQDGRAPAVDPATLARWLDAGRDDEGREVAMLDTRNGFEVAAGSFDGALDLGLRSFGDLPGAIAPLCASLADKRVVAFCTGGIRCEKAVLHMREAGLSHAVQLEGGVLRWFEALGGRHWHGELFVFDERVGLTPALRPVAA
jgi:UPF0176 protein